MESLSFKIIGGDTTAQKAVKNAVDKWNSKLNDISLIEVSENEKADITINFNQEATATNVDTTSLNGNNIWSSRPGQSVNNFDASGLIANSFISISRNAFDNSLSSNKIEQLALHELGHALGLGHASFNGDLMSSVITGRKKVISSCDIMSVELANQWKKLEATNGSYHISHYFCKLCVNGKRRTSEYSYDTKFLQILYGTSNVYGSCTIILIKYTFRRVR